MSGSLPSGRRLLWRAGPYWNARPPKEPVGTTATVIFELVDTQTGLLLAAPGLSVIAWRPRPGGFPEQAVPLIPALLSPGRWQADVIGEMPGRYSLQAVSLSPARETVTAKIDFV